MKQSVCSICGYIDDEAASGKWEDLPVDWKYPLCGKLSILGRFYGSQSPPYAAAQGGQGGGCLRILQPPQTVDDRDLKR